MCPSVSGLLDPVSVRLMAVKLVLTCYQPCSASSGSRVVMVIMTDPRKDYLDGSWYQKLSKCLSLDQLWSSWLGPGMIQSWVWSQWFLWSRLSWKVFPCIRFVPGVFHSHFFCSPLTSNFFFPHFFAYSRIDILPYSIMIPFIFVIIHHLYYSYDEIQSWWHSILL